MRGFKIVASIVHGRVLTRSEENHAVAEKGRRVKGQRGRQSVKGEDDAQGKDVKKTIKHIEKAC